MVFWLLLLFFFLSQLAYEALAGALVLSLV